MPSEVYFRATKDGGCRHATYARYLYVPISVPLSRYSRCEFVRTDFEVDM